MSFLTKKCGNDFTRYTLIFKCFTGRIIVLIKGEMDENNSCRK